MNKTLKKISSKLHLWLGLSSGIIVFIIAITGCLWVFQEEITHLIEGERIVIAQNAPFLNPEEAKEIAATVFPNKIVHGVAYKHENDPIEVIFYEAEPEFYWSVFINPYDGKNLEIKNHREGFFWFILRGHLYLWLPNEIGHQLARYGTMIFVILLLSGIILWWPKNRKSFERKTRIKWKKITPWRRKNYDLHSIGGFYISILALLIAYTGLIMAFDWIYYVTYKSWGGDKQPQFVVPENISSQNLMLNETEDPMDEIIPIIQFQYPDYKSIEVHFPDTENASLYVEVATQEGVYFNRDFLFFDARTLEEIDSNSIYGKYETAGIADKVLRMTYDIHIGAIGGLPGKILAFFISLSIASLPITGFIFWWGKRNKK